MKIGAISELSIASIDFNSLSSTNNQYLIEISEQNDNILYNSKQYDLAYCMKQIGQLIQQLQNNIKSLSDSINATRSEYLHLSGGTLTGSLNIGSNDNPISNPLNIFANITNNTAIQTNIPAVNFGGVVHVDNDGILHCTQDIDGCALTAKWS